MSLINYALSGSLKNFSKKLDGISKKTGKSKTRLFLNFLHCFLMTGGGYSDYLNYEFYKKTRKEIKEYATIKTQDTFYGIVSPDKYKNFFSVKSNFLKNFSEYIERDSFHMGTKKELEDFLKRNKQIVYKPVSGLAGTSVKRMASKDIKDLNAFYKEITEDKDILLEGFVEQHHEISEFAENSCNTIRVMTFGYNGHSEILCAIMRFGNGIADVDNFHQGGMACLVDVETGTLVGDAINKNVEHFEKHPKSGKKFDGFKIPNWDIVKKTCLEAALKSDKIHVVGWDVAVTEKGCTFIEGNRRAGFDLVQVLYRKGKKDIMRHVLEEMNKEGEFKGKIKVRI